MPIFSRSSVVKYFTEAFVETGMKKGVSMLAFFVLSIAVLAFVFLSWWVIVKEVIF